MFVALDFCSPRAYILIEPADFEPGFSGMIYAQWEHI
jgi:hypothetical protein